MARNDDRPAGSGRTIAWERTKLAVNIVFVALLLGSGLMVLGLHLADRSARDPNRVELIYMYWGGPEQFAQEEEIKAAFAERVPQIDVQFLAVNRFDSRLAAMIASGQPPDVFLTSSATIAKLADRAEPVLADIGPLVLADREEMDFADFLPQAVRPFYCNGRLYGLPRDFKTTGVAYNADMLAALNLEDPNALFARDEWTWETFLDYLGKLNRDLPADKGRPMHVYGLFQDSFNEGYWANILLQAGGGIFGNDGRTLLIDTPESLAGLQFLHDLAWTHKVAKPWSAEGGVADPWVARETAMLGFRGWFTSRYINSTYDSTAKAFKFAWDVAPWPMGPIIQGVPEALNDDQGKLTGYRVASGRVVLPGAVYLTRTADGWPGYRLRQCTAGGIGYCMSAKTRHPQAAWTLLKFLVSPQAQRIRARIPPKCDPNRIVPGPNMPSRVSQVAFYLDTARRNTLRPRFAGSLAHKNEQPLWPRIDVFINARDYSHTTPGSLGADEIGRELDRQIQRLFTYPNVTPRQVASAAREKADKVQGELRGPGFASSFNDPSLVRPAGHDPLGLAP